MSKSNHTLGPWAWSGRQLLARRHMASDSVMISESYPWHPSDGDKNLIAAAPELLEALEAITKVNIALPFGLREQAEAAIAKAKGGES